jgi:alginate biosynthesis protein Alg44
METGRNLKVVHASETQRQHPRVRVPGTVQFAAGGVVRRYPLYDLSAGGFSFECAQDRYQVGGRFQGELSFTVDGVSFAIPAPFEIRHCTPAQEGVGARFHDLDQRQIAALRHLINGYLTGELVSVGDMIATLSRNNFTPSRGAIASGGGLSIGGRLRAVAVTGTMVLLGAVAFFYAATKLYDLLFVTHSTAAKVAAPIVTITMPRDGTFFDLVPEGGTVKKGAPLASFQTAMLEVLQGDPGALHLPPDQLTQLLGAQLKGSIASPCDCKVHKRFAVDAEYVNRAQPLFELLPQNAAPYILARFHYDQLDQLQPGRMVNFTISNAGSLRTGKVMELRALTAPVTQAGGYTDLSGLNNSNTTTDVIAVIQPTQPIDAALIDQPADVRVGMFSNNLASLGGRL